MERDEDVLLEEDRWYSPWELDLELGGELLKEAAKAEKERPFLEIEISSEEAET